jgi:GMP synthase (glutamine-hydrolysing)
MTAAIQVAIVDCGSSKVPDIVRILTLSGVEAQVIAPAELKSLEPDLPAAIIISGNPTLIQDTGTAFLEDFEPLKELTIPVLGICFGHQVIGLLYGAEVTTGKEDRDLRQLQILKSNQLFAGLSTEDSFQEDHTEEVSIPDHFVRLAASSLCSNEAMKHSKLPFFGVQFHPESSGQAGMQLLQNFLALTGEAAG